MSKNLYKVKDKMGVKRNINADFYETCKSTGVSTFYVEHDDIKEHSPELVATISKPHYIYLASSNKKSCKMTAKILSELNDKLKETVATSIDAIDGFKGAFDEAGVDYGSYAMFSSISEDGLFNSIYDLQLRVTLLLNSAIALKSTEKPEGGAACSRDVVIHFRQWPEYEISGDYLFINTRFTVHHKEAE